MVKKRTDKVSRARQMIMTFLALIAIGFFGISIYYGTGVKNSGPIEEGEDYVLLENPLRTQNRDIIDVTEYFSYRCIHCKSFEPLLEDWLTSVPKDVSFGRQHVVFSASDELFARTHLVLTDNSSYQFLHARLFAAIHDRQKRFGNKEAITDYLKDYGIDESIFNREFNSPRISRALQKDRSTQGRSQLAATPSLLVSGKYLISMANGQERALAVASNLVNKERSLRAKTSP